MILIRIGLESFSLISLAFFDHFHGTTIKTNTLNDTNAASSMLNENFKMKCLPFSSAAILPRRISTAEQ